MSYLHSTMVLFKYCINQCNTNVTLFTFHYGPIQISTIYCKYIHKTNIYIPLWSYSNAAFYLFYRFVNDLHSTMVLFKLRCLHKKFSRLLFTFHYGPIQIYSHLNLSLRDCHLHSTMVLFK